MDKKPGPYDDRGRVVLRPEPGDIDTMHQIRRDDLKIATAAVINLLQRLGDYPECVVVDLHEASQRMQATLLGLTPTE